MRYWCLFLLFFTCFIKADIIEVYNKTQTKIFLAYYYVSLGGKAKRVGKIYNVEKQASSFLGKPKMRFGYRRYVAYTFKKSRLKVSFSRKNFKKVKHRSYGTFSGKKLYIALNKKELKGYTKTQWQLRPVAKKIEKGIKRKIREHYPESKLNPYCNTIARVRISKAISPQEKKYIQYRTSFVRKYLKTFLSYEIPKNYTPKIAFMGSGGGYRAMLSTLGFLSGAKKMGLLDCTFYIAGVSGSTWTIGTWMSSKHSIRYIKNLLISYSGKKIHKLTRKEKKAIMRIILLKYAHDQPITSVDFYGAILANNLLRHKGKNKQKVYLSNQRKYIDTGQRPFPIYTAVRGESERSEKYWYEFNPYEIGAHWLGIYVPTWAYGRKFKQGISINFSPEQSLGFHFGTYGSAYASTFNRMYKEFASDVPLFAKPVIEKILKKLGHVRIDSTKVLNFSYKMPQSPLKTKGKLKLVDAGFDFNIPYPPLSGEVVGRKPDILIFFDASEDAKDAKALKKAEQYAKRKKLPFPYIDYEVIGKEAVSIFSGKTSKIPTIIYFPLLSDQKLWKAHRENSKYKNFRKYLDGFDISKAKYIKTFDFKYTNFQANQITALTEFAIRANKERIVKAIKQKILQNSK